MLNRREMTIGALHTNAVSMRRAMSEGRAGPDSSHVQLVEDDGKDNQGRRLCP